jgi:hypothetical protein
MQQPPMPVERQSIDSATREAIERPLDYSPAERAKTIRKMIKEMVPLVQRGTTQDELQRLYPSETEQYPELFKKIVAKQDLTPINTMLAMLDKMASGSINQHQASVIVGQRLVDRFVTPQLRGHGQDTQGR